MVWDRQELMTEGQTLGAQTTPKDNMWSMVPLECSTELLALNTPLLSIVI